MNDERLRQRIAYLVENGVLDDPLEDIRRDIRRLFALATVGVGCGVGVLVVHLV
jgi:hypothetical protein